MMNKKIAAVLGLALMFTACGNNDNTAPDMSVTESETVTEASAESETASETASETTAEVSEETLAETEAVTEAITEASSEEQEAENTADYRDAYKAKLIEVMYDENATSPSFDLFDMDNDGIPELFMSIDNYHAAGVFAYTFKNGTLVNLSGGNTTFGSYGEAAVSADGYLTSGYMGMGMTSDYFYKLEGDKLVLKKSIVSEEFPDPTDDDPYHFSLKYKVNDEYVTEEEYNSAFDEYDAHDWVTVGRGTLISAANVDSVLYAE